MERWRWLGLGILVKATRNLENRLWILWFMSSLFLLTVPAILYTGNYGDRYWAMGLIGWSLLYATELPRLFAVLPLPIWIFIIGFRGMAWQSDLNFWQQEVALNPHTIFSCLLSHHSIQRRKC